MTPRATPGRPEYTITLTDGTVTLGFQTPGKTGIRRLPRGAGAERKAVGQGDWSGGRGNERLSADQTKFFDSYNLWSQVAGQVCNGPMLIFGYGQDTEAPCEKSFQAMPWLDSPGTISSDDTVKIVQVPNTGALSRNFTTTTTFTSFYLYLPIRKLGTPAQSLTIEINPVLGGGVIQTGVSTTIAPGAVTHNELHYVRVAFAADFAADGDYQLAVSTTGGTAENQWQVMCTADSMAPYFRVSAAQVKALKKVKFFEYKRQLYALVMYPNGSGRVIMNGDRGVAKGSQSTTTLTDSSRSWATDQWVGCSCLIIDGTNKGEYRTIIDNTSTTLTISSDDPWPIAPTPGGSVYVILGSERWTEENDRINATSALSDSGLTGPTDVVVFGDFVYFAQGDSVSMRRMRERKDGSDWKRDFEEESSAGKFTLLCATTHHTKGSPVIAGAKMTNEVNVAPAPADFATDLNWEFPAIKVNVREADLNAIVDYDNQLNAGFDDSIWALKNGKFSKVPLTTERARDERNNQAMAWWNTQLFLAFLGGLERLYGSTLDDIGPDRGTGMPSNARGHIVDLVPVANKLYASYRNENGRSGVMVTTDPGGDWHCLWRWPSAARGQSGLWYQTVPGQANRLWMANWNELFYLTMPDDLHNPANDPDMRYWPEGYLVTAWLDADSPQLDHFFHHLRLSTKNLTGATRYIEIEYQLDDADYLTGTWTKLTTAANTSPFQRIVLGSEDVTGHKVRFRYRMVCDGLTPALLNAYELRLVQMNEVVYDFVFDMSLADRIMLMTGKDTRQTVDALIDQIELWKEDATPLTIQFPAPYAGQSIAGLKGHLDPVSLVTGEWSDDKLNLTGNIVFKSIS